MKRYEIPLFVFTLLFASNVFANPLDVFNGKRSTSPYPQVPDNNKSTGVKIEGKEVMLPPIEPENSNAQEHYEMKGTVSNGNNVDNKIEIPKIDTEDLMTEEAKNLPDFVGTWVKTGLTINGSPNPFSPTTMTLKKDSFIAQADCTTSGDLRHDKDTITLIMKQDSCPDNLPTPMAVTYSYTISEDNKTLNWQTSVITETFARQ